MLPRSELLQGSRNPDLLTVVIDQAEQLSLSGRDSLRILAALEQPAAPNAKLLKAARRLPKRP